MFAERVRRQPKDVVGRSADTAGRAGKRNRPAVSSEPVLAAPTVMGSALLDTGATKTTRIGRGWEDTSGTRDSAFRHGDAGTRSTRIARRPGAVIQRKTLKDAGLDTGLTDAGETRAVIGAGVEGGGLAGKVYANPVLAKAADKAAALRAAAVAAGAVGTRVDTWGRRGQVGAHPKRGWSPPRMFTRESKDMNKAEVTTLDPFFHRVAVPYVVADTDHALVLEYQHAASHQGYISNIMDSASEPIKGGAAMYHGKSTKKQLVDYSTQHAELEGNLLAATSGTGEASVDAYTKLAGEGARWVCVRDNINKLRDTSMFYCADPKNSKQVLSVQFLELWVHWADTFDKKYDIPNSAVIAALKSGRIGEPEAVTEIDPSVDVNLEA